MSTSSDVRAALVSALQADLIGPFDPTGRPGAATELLPLAPSRWYLTGFLAPRNDREMADPTSEEGLAAGSDDDEEESSSTSSETEAKQKNQFPASMGMSVFLPAAKAGETIHVTVSFAEYVREDGKGRKAAWRRVPQPPRSLDLPLDAALIEKGVSLPNTPSIRIAGKLEAADAPGLAAGTRALSLFVVNDRTPGEKGRQDEQFIFQVEMELKFDRGFVPRPNRRGEGGADPDDTTSDLQFRTHYEWAVGHGVAVDVPDDQDPVTCIRTTWIPTAEVRKVDTHEEPNVVTVMDDLADRADGPSLVQALAPIVEAYGAWIDGQEAIALDSDARKDARKRLVKNARRAKDRIAAGIDLLAKDSQVREAFQLMNRAMSSAAIQRSPTR
ncbi:MAG TPA: DNA/RNA helicase, partial [Polyangiaceae bacterium]